MLYASAKRAKRTESRLVCKKARQGIGSLSFEGVAAAVFLRQNKSHRLPVDGLAVRQVEAELELVRHADGRRARLVGLLLGQEVGREARRRRGRAHERGEFLEKGPPAALARSVSC